ncbi:MAG: hypothetical protein A2199_07630 [Hydrogenophilales bacterium RIFOXYA1_FULL_63_33]|nr:MAG: hypothetical protein A2199_07630 [Hydrogenophilales bacterium RIFOXYA1_FULL_63_33]
MRTKILGLVAVGLLVIPYLAGNSVQAAPILQTDITTGTLSGALNVDVNGTLYDVRFVDGTCMALFSGCDNGSDFPFATLAEATAAGQALLDFVFINIPGSYRFDEFPGQTVGCLGTSTACSVYIPTGIANDGSVQGVVAVNNISIASDFVGGLAGLAPSYDTAANDSQHRFVWAAWSQPVTVPEPGALSIMVAGLLGLAFTRAGRRMPSGNGLPR